MNLSDLEGKEIINIYNGCRLGLVAGTDIIFNPRNGHLESIVIPEGSGLMGFFGQEKYLVIPWESIVKVGDEVIIVDLDSDNYEEYISKLEY